MRSLARKNLDLDEESEFERRDWWISLREEFEGGIEEEMGGETADSEIEKTLSAISGRAERKLGCRVTQCRNAGKWRC